MLPVIACISSVPSSHDHQPVRSSSGPSNDHGTAVVGAVPWSEAGSITMKCGEERETARAASCGSDGRCCAGGDVPANALWIYSDEDDDDVDWVVLISSVSLSFQVSVREACVRPFSSPGAAPSSIG